MDSNIQPSFTPCDISVQLVTLSAERNIAVVLTAGNHAHALAIVLHGVAELFLGERILRLDPDTVLIINENSVMRAVGHGPAKIWIVRCTEHFIKQCLYSVNTEAVARMFTPMYLCFHTETYTYKIIKKLVMLLHKHCMGNASKNSQTICQVTFNLLCNCLLSEELPVGVAINRHPNRQENVTVRFFNLVSEHVMQHHKVEFYAGKLCMTRGNLAKIVKQVAGKTPKSVIETTLVGLAIRYLEETMISINELSDTLGFKSGSAFINFFRNQTGVTPNDYRNRNKKSNGNS